MKSNSSNRKKFRIFSIAKKTSTFFFKRSSRWVEKNSTKNTSVAKRERIIVDSGSGRYFVFHPKKVEPFFLGHLSAKTFCSDQTDRHNTHFTVKKFWQRRPSIGDQRWGWENVENYRFWNFPLVVIFIVAYLAVPVGNVSLHIAYSVGSERCYPFRHRDLSQQILLKMLRHEISRRRNIGWRIATCSKGSRSCPESLWLVYNETIKLNTDFKYFFCWVRSNFGNDSDEIQLN